MSFLSRTAACSALGLSILALVPASAPAAVMNFDSRQHGEKVDDDYLASMGVVVSAKNFQGGPNLAIAFDTTRTGTADPDLEDPWDRGNIPSNEKLYDILIIAENSRDANGNGLIDSPDDQAETATVGSGELRFNFNTIQRSFGLDLIDVEAEWGLDPWFISFRLAGVEVSRVTFDKFLDSSSPFFTPGVVFGDNSANRIDPMTAEEMTIRGFNEVVINMRGSGGVNNISFEAGTVVPEPSSALIGTGLLLPLLARRRRSPKN
jgi:hypothetical protein